MAVEQASYQVLAKEGPFELRLYEPMVIVTCEETDLAGGDGFSKLFNYISGNNRKSKKISMTAPVINHLEARQSTMAFVMPTQYRLQDLPQPNDPALQLKEIQGRRIAAITFSGRTSTRAISQRRTELQEWVQKKQWLPVGDTELARYNPPFLPAFLRRNELLIEIQSD